MNNELLVIYKSVLSTLQNYLASFYDDLLMIHEEVIIEDSFDKLTSFFDNSDSNYIDFDLLKQKISTFENELHSAFFNKDLPFVESNINLSIKLLNEAVSMGSPHA